MKKTIRLLSVCTAIGLSILAGLALLAQTPPRSIAKNTQQSGYAENWLDNTQQVLELAKKENKAVLINFTGSDWCPPCIMLKREIFSTPEFKAFADKHLILQVADFPRGIRQSDALKEQNLELAQKYSIVSFPTLIILNSEGQQIGLMQYRQQGVKPFLDELGKIIGIESDA